MSQQYALVKWCGGDFDKTYTPEVPIEWIRGFDYEAYADDNFDFEEVYTVKWHDTARCLRGGWKLYDAYIIAISENKKVLNQKMRILEESNPPLIRLSLDMIDSDPINRKSEKKNSSLSQHRNASDELTSKKCKITHEATQSGSTDLKLKKPSGKSTKKILKTTVKNQNDRTESSTTTRNEVFAKVTKNSCDNVTKNLETLDEGALSDEADLPVTDDKTDNEDLDAINGPSTSTSTSRPVSNEDVMQKVNAVYDKVSNIEKLLQKGVSSGNNQNSKTGKPFKKGEFYVEEVELGKPGSGVKVDGIRWTSAISKNSPIHMVKTLLPCLFELDVLLDSNYKGGASKNQKENSTQRKRLDPKIIEALKFTVNQTFPGNMSDSEFGQAINGKITSLRWQINNREKNVSTDDQE